MYKLYFSTIFFFNKAKNVGISIDLARLFNAVEGKKNLKLAIDNCEQLLKSKKLGLKILRFVDFDYFKLKLLGRRLV